MHYFYLLELEKKNHNLLPVEGPKIHLEHHRHLLHKHINQMLFRLYEVC